MMIREIEAKTLLRKQKRIDSWFISSYNINLYRGCSHNCTYCDGRTETYQVNHEFGAEVEVKVNALEILKRELDPVRKRKPFNNGFFVVCGGVSDSYQAALGNYRITRGALELLHRFNHPVHILTKSTLVEKDMDILKRIDHQRKALVSFSFSTVDDTLGRKLEPGVPLPSRRLETLKRLKDRGLSTGVFLMPVIPFVTDTEERIEESVTRIHEAGADYIVFGGLTLKEGRQKDYFLAFIQQEFPHLVKSYREIYQDSNQWGAPSTVHESIEELFSQAAAKVAMPRRIPPALFQHLVSRSELVMILLDQLDYLARTKGKKSPYGYGAYSLFKSGKDIETMDDQELLAMKGIGPVTVTVIKEILERGTSSLYESLLV